MKKEKDRKKAIKITMIKIGLKNKWNKISMDKIEKIIKKG